MTTFRDHFSAGAADYASYRPTYPDELFESLASAAPHRDLAWDCGTGSGQATAGLAGRFDRVIATDASRAQLHQAPVVSGVYYAAAVAEVAPLRSGSVSLVTVAQALHWMDAPRFWDEARRVLAPGGVVAAWTYGRCETLPAIDGVVDHFYASVVGPFWPPERVHVETGYRDLPFPFDLIDVVPCTMRARWTLEQFAGYLRTWSATQRYAAHYGVDPVADVVERIASLWGDPVSPRAVTWPLAVRAGRAP